MRYNELMAYGSLLGYQVANALLNNEKFSNTRRISR